MEENDFYVVLPSNVKLPRGISHQNRTNHFKTYLPRALNFQDYREWVVGLAQINFPQSWSKTIPLERCSYSFQKHSYDPATRELLYKTLFDHEQGTLEYKSALNILKQYDESTKMVINCSEGDKNKEASPSKDVKHLVEFLNNSKPETMKGEFKYNSTGKISVTLLRGESIELKRNLADILGFRDTNIMGYTGVPLDTSKVTDEHIFLREYYSFQRALDSENSDRMKHAIEDAEYFKRLFSQAVENDDQGLYYEVTADSGVDTNTMYNMFVYCNLVENTLVGDVLVPLLRAIPIYHGDDDKYVGKNFNRIRYRPLARNFFECIEIQLADDTGELVNFQYGKAILTLHVKKRNM